MPEVRIEERGDGAVRVLTLDRAEKRNALTLDMFRVLTAAFAAEPPPAQRLTLLRAEGSVFCAGVDLGERSDEHDGESPLEALCRSVRAYPLPVVAAVQGHAIGGGFMLLTHCDVVVAVAEAKLGNAAVQLGLVPPWPLARRVQEAAGPALARELLVLGELVSAGRLADAGVIAAAVESERLDEEVAAVVDRIAANAPLSLRAIKATLTAPGFAAAPHDHADALLARARASEDAKEGVRARRERRDPSYTGR